MRKEIIFKLVKSYLEDISLNTSLVLTDHFKRLSFEFSILDFSKCDNVSFLDVGGGDGLLAGLINYAYGKIDCYVVDDYQDQNSYEKELIDYLKERGVNFINADASLDQCFISTISSKKKIYIISCLNSIEHWHNSPAEFLINSYENIKKGGKLVLAFPNNSNIKKRLLAVIGKTSWSNFDYWFDNKEFRGHIREPNVKDLKLIAMRVGCDNFNLYGRNYLGFFNPNQLVRILTNILDPFLRFIPSLCSDLYIVMNKSE